MYIKVSFKGIICPLPVEKDKMRIRYFMSRTAKPIFYIRDVFVINTLIFRSPWQTPREFLAVLPRCLDANLSGDILAILCTQLY